MDLQDFSEEERDCLWERVSSDHAKWLSRKASKDAAEKSGRLQPLLGFRV